MRRPGTHSEPSRLGVTTAAVKGQRTPCLLRGSDESGRPGSNRQRPAWEAFWALAGQGFFGGGSRNGITQYEQVGFVLPISPSMRDLLAEHGVGLRLDDPRFLGESLQGHFHGPLTEVKEQAGKWVA